MPACSAQKGMHAKRTSRCDSACTPAPSAREELVYSSARKK
jgi:hypothetical protein